MKDVFLALAAIVLLGACTANPLDVGSHGDTGPGPSPDDDEDCRNGQQLPIVGTWTGYIENFQLASGTDKIQLTFTSATAARACGKVTLGTKTPPNSATDPDIGYPPGRPQPGPDEQLELGMIGLSEGFPMTMRDGSASATRMRFIASWHECWRSWCVLQNPVLSGQADSSGNELYSCLPSGDWSDDGHCFVAVANGVDGGFERRPVDCDKLLLCFRQVCLCSNTSCTDRPDADFTFDLRITGNEAAGSVQIGANSGEFHNVYLTQSK